MRISYNLNRVEIQGLKPFQIEMNPQKGKGGAPVQTIFSQEQVNEPKNLY